ncbi:hypothetical protein [Clostridium sp.]
MTQNTSFADYSEVMTLLYAMEKLEYFLKYKELKGRNYPVL